MDGGGGRTDSVIHSLIYCRLHPAPLVTNIPHLSYLPRRKITQSKLHEFPLLVQIIDRAQRFLKRHRPVRRVQVKDIDRLGPKLAQRLVRMLLEAVGLVDTGFVGIALRRKG